MPRCLGLLEPRRPVTLVLREVAEFVGEDCLHIGLSDWMLHGATLRRDLDCGAGNSQQTVAACGGEFAEERHLIGEDAELVARNHVELKQLRVEEAWRPSAGNHCFGVDLVDVFERPSELAIDFCVDEFAHALGGLFVDHWVPDGAAVLQPVQIDRTVLTQRIEIGSAAVVLIEQTRLAIADHQG